MLSVSAEPRNERGELRASIPFQRVDGLPRLEELWFLWSLCNLACRHCYVGSSPRNNSLEMLTLADIGPFLAEAREFQVARVYFTGGEPFVNPEIVPMLEAALAVAPVTVLTNGLGPIERRLDELERLREQLTLRVSLDHFDEARHDAIRGPGSFARTTRTIRELVRRAFRPIVTVTPIVFEGTPATREEAESAFRALLGDGVELKFLPATLAMGSELARRPQRPHDLFLTDRHMAGTDLRDFQCHYGRSVQKIGGRMRVFPCPILYGDESFALGSTLAESFEPVSMAHSSCAQFCWRARGKCGDPARAGRGA